MINIYNLKKTNYASGKEPYKIPKFINVGEYIIEHAIVKNPKDFDEQNPKELQHKELASRRC